MSAAARLKQVENDVRPSRYSRMGNSPIKPA